MDDFTTYTRDTYLHCLPVPAHTTCCPTFTMTTGLPDRTPKLTCLPHCHAALHLFATTTYTDDTSTAAFRPFATCRVHLLLRIFTLCLPATPATARRTRCHRVPAAPRTAAATCHLPPRTPHRCTCCYLPAALARTRAAAAIYYLHLPAATPALPPLHRTRTGSCAALNNTQRRSDTQPTLFPATRSCAMVAFNRIRVHSGCAFH